MKFRNFTLVAFHLSYFFFFSAILASNPAAASYDICAQELHCRPDGPAIRFPFRLQDKQPEHCGYPGFNLLCDSSSHTVLELPSSVKLLVKNISYESHVIQVYDPQSCFPKQIRNFSTSNAYSLKFSSWAQFSLFNCSQLLAKNRSSSWKKIQGFDIDCLDTPGYKVHATSSETSISILPLELCSKMYTTWAPEEAFGEENRIQLRWFLPECEKCERKRGICAIKNGTKDKINCSVNLNSDTKTKKLIITGEIMGPLVLLLAISAACYIYYSKKMYEENQVKIKKFLEDYKAMKPTRYSYLDLKRITNDFKEQLGEGAYGTVFKGKISDEVFVAVKLLQDSKRNGQEFINEVATMARIHHANVVRLIGFCADGFRQALIYEFLPNGSLDKLFSRNEQYNALGWDKMQEIAIGIARGIEYLHQGSEQRILHLDIKPHNIMLDDNFNPKISDFGLAKLCEKGKSAVSMTGARGTVGYMAPEVYSRHFGNVSFKSDIYSFGMLLLEMVGRRKNIDKKVQNVSEMNFPRWIYQNLVNGEDLGIQVEGGEKEITRKLAVVGLWCIRWNPVDRPSATFVVRMLEGNGEDLNLPPNPFTSTNPTSSTTHRGTLNSALEIISESE